jgi:hypothetical protein
MSWSARLATYFHRHDFVSQEWLADLQSRERPAHERNLSEPHTFAEHTRTVYPSPWRQTEGSLKEGW